MTFVTDFAANMPRIVTASVSSPLVPLSDKWMGCFSHQLNTDMKHVVSSLSEHSEGALINSDILAVKEILTAVKQAHIELPSGFSLMQECETRFGTTNDVIERFLKSAYLLRAIDHEKVMAGMTKLQVTYLPWSQCSCTILFTDTPCSNRYGGS